MAVDVFPPRSPQDFSALDLRLDAIEAVPNGFRNKVINGDFRINQRQYVSGTVTANGSYMLDRWKVALLGTTGAFTFTAAPNGQAVSIKISANVLQVIERENMPAGNYVLSWAGTALGRVYNSGSAAPTSVASPILVSLDGTADVVVEFWGGAGGESISKVQLEAGSVPTPFEQRPYGLELALCQRYFWRLNSTAAGDDICTCYMSSTTAAVGVLSYPVTMRTMPSGSRNPASAINVSAITSTGGAMSQNTTQTMRITVTGCVGLTSGNGSVFGFASSTGYLDFDAEI
jgi:hypothetical protein